MAFITSAVFSVLVFLAVFKDVKQFLISVVPLLGDKLLKFYYPVPIIA
ncbi:MAG: hypothetical protein WBG48_07095 [Pricia sp.]